MSRLPSLVLVALLVALMLPLTACGPSTPEGKIAAVRADYTVEINSWRVKKDDPPPMEEAMEGEATEAEALEAEATAESTEEDGEEAAMEEERVAGPQTTNILFDLLVLFRGPKSLQGVTIDITHASSAEVEKAVYQRYIETPNIVKGDTQQHDFVMEGLAYEEGDVFSVEIVSGVPQDLSLYREFAEQAP